MCMHSTWGCASETPHVHSISNAKLAPDPKWALIWVNFASIQEIGPKLGPVGFRVLYWTQTEEQKTGEAWKRGYSYPSLAGVYHTWLLLSDLFGWYSSMCYEYSYMQAFICNCMFVPDKGMEIWLYSCIVDWTQVKYSWLYYMMGNIHVLLY